MIFAFSASMLLVGRQKKHPPVKNFEWWGTGMVICLERDADLHMAQLMPLPLTVSCFSKIQIGFTFLVPPTGTETKLSMGAKSFSQTSPFKSMVDGQTDRQTDT